MTAAEHLDWMKERALLELEHNGKPANAIASIVSDCSKHEDWFPKGAYLFEDVMRRVNYNDPAAVKAWVQELTIDG